MVILDLPLEVVVQVVIREIVDKQGLVIICILFLVVVVVVVQILHLENQVVKVEQVQLFLDIE